MQIVTELKTCISTLPDLFRLSQKLEIQSQACFKPLSIKCQINLSIPLWVYEIFVRKCFKANLQHILSIISQ